MDILPAIDLRSGKCVRLIQGQYHRQITYGDDPAAQAKQFLADGSKWLHIVDLDGARLGRPSNTEAIKAITSAVDMNIEVGGGIRDDDAISELLDIGVNRVIIGTNAISEFDWFTKATAKFPNKLVLGLDARGSHIATHGWEKDGTHNLLDFAIEAAKLPLAAIVYTDITKDGMMAGPNLERTQTLINTIDTPIVAAGGVTEIEDVINLKRIGAAGAIIGRSIYEGKIDLKDAIKASLDE